MNVPLSPFGWQESLASSYGEVQYAGSKVGLRMILTIKSPRGTTGEYLKGSPIYPVQDCWKPRQIPLAVNVGYVTKSKTAVEWVN